MQPLIVVQGLAKAFGDTSALAAVDFSVGPTEFVAIIGPSGSGKTTLLRCVAGLERPTSGRVLISGDEVLGPPRHCVYVFQDYARSLLPWRSLLRNVMFPIERQLGKREATEHARHFISMVGLSERESAYPWQLSGGMQQRVAIARALAAETSVLLMDEPFAAVDAQTRMELQDMLLRIWRELAKTILFVTHDIDEAVYLADRILVLDHSGVMQMLEIVLPRPRAQSETRRLPAFAEYRDQLLSLIRKRE